MKVVQGHPVNLTSSIIGRVSVNGGKVCLRKDSIYVSERITKRVWGYSAIVVGQSMNLNVANRKPFVFGLTPGDLSFLQEDDVALLEPNGLVTVLWDADSPHNSIFLTNTCNCK